MMLQQQANPRNIGTAGNQSHAGLNGTQQLADIQQNQRRITTTQGGNRDTTGKRGSGNGVSYPTINQNNTQDSPNKGRMIVQTNNHQMHSLDRSHNQQISQGIQIRDSYKEQAQQIQNQIKRRPQTGGNNAQVQPTAATAEGSQSQAINNRDYNQLGYSAQVMQDANHKNDQNQQNGQGGKKSVNQGIVNKRSISGASNKNQFSFNAMKSSTPKN